MAGERIATLDLIRGVAILGILAVNIAGFAGPMAATVSPAWNGTPSPGDEGAFLATFVLFEGKMRGLLSLLFGASMVLLIESAEARGRSGDLAQLKRLIWLAVIGYLHFALLWWGDILFAYAFAGFFALLLRHLPVKIMLPLALFTFAIWHGGGMAGSANAVLADLRYEAGASPPVEASRIEQERKAVQISADTELRRERGGWGELATYKLTEQARFPIVGALIGLGETLPMMLIGMVLYRSGFFTGGWPRRRSMLLAGGTLVFGLAGWIAMLTLSPWWQARFGQGPVERIWRNLAKSRN